ncbi:MAG: membrane protein insertase YidC [Chthonomonas sp.]|nr:membrane protein insertase YidC [Chthonomonas sp.]
MTFVLLAMFIFLGMQLFQGARSGGNDYRDPSEILASLRTANKELNGDKTRTDNQLFQQRIETFATEQKWTAEQTAEAKAESEVLDLHTRLAAGLKINNLGKIQEVWQSIEPKERKAQKDAMWTKEFKVAPAAGLPDETMSMKELWDTSTVELNKRYKTEPVFGFIPGWQLMDGLVALTGRIPAFSYAFSALLLAIIVRAAIFVPVTKQLRWSKQMQQLQPLVKEIQEEFQKKDPVGWRSNPELQKRSMALYQEYGINPVAGCLPMLIQIPFFWAIYQCMLHYRFEFAKGTFLWISEAGHSLNAWFAPNLGKTDYLLVLIYGVSMLVSQMMQPAPDPNNARQHRMMGIFVSLMVSVMMFFFPLPSAFVLYWIFLNIFATAHVLWINKQPVKPLQKVNAPGGGVFPTELNGGGFFKSTGRPATQKPKKK